jgi:hypothetical protein
MALVKHNPIDLAYRTEAVEVAKKVFYSYRLGSYKDYFSIDLIASLYLDTRGDRELCRTTEHVLL